MSTESIMTDADKFKLLITAEMPYLLPLFDFENSVFWAIANGLNAQEITFSGRMSMKLENGLRTVLCKRKYYGTYRTRQN